MQQTTIAIPLSSAGDASIELDFGAGELLMSALAPDSGDLISGTFTYDEDWGQPEYTSDASGTTHFVHIRQKHGAGHWPGAHRGPTWDLLLNPRVPVTLVFKSGASKANLDLSSTQVRSLTVDVGANDTTVVFPSSAGYTEARVKAGAASLQLNVPEGVAARIAVSSGLASINIDRRFRRQGSIYISEGYDTAPNKLDLHIDVGVSSVSVR